MSNYFPDDSSAVECPDDFKGSKRYVSQEDLKKARSKRPRRTLNPGDPRIFFGKYEGTRISKIPHSYLRWVLTLKWKNPKLIPLKKAIRRLFNSKE